MQQNNKNQNKEIKKKITKLTKIRTEKLSEKDKREGRKRIRGRQKCGNGRGQKCGGKEYKLKKV